MSLADRRRKHGEAEMGKIVKFCTSCDEGFAEKFAFCPNCASSLQSFEMSPVKAETPPVVETSSAWAAADIVEPVAPKVAEVEAKAAPKIVEVAEEPVVQVKAAPESVEAVKVPFVEEPIAAVPAAKPAAAPAFVHSMPIDVDRKPVSLEAEHDAYVSKGEFYVTVIEEKNVGTRNALLLGTLGVMIMSLLVGTVVSLYLKDLEVGSINDDIFNAMLLDEVPSIVEEEVKPKQKDDGGGGGGGGREEKEETTQGDLADQSPKPTRPPDAKVFRSDNFELKMPPPQTEGNRTFEKKFDRWGDPNGRFASFSNGTGSGGGQGSGTGTGQGSGRGTGAGSGDGSGSGSGLGSGNGSGTGSGDGGSPPPPPARPVGVTAGLKIISKPRPGYTDAARQNNIQGTVILRVTFLASGQIGSISSVKGLPNGLTEQAIAAARRISFEPAKRDGQGQSVTKQIEYSFSIY